MKKFETMAVSMIVMTLAILVPPAIAHAIGQSAAAGALVLPVVAGLVPARLADLRTALWASVGVAIASAAAAWTSGDAVLAAMVMAATALAMGTGCRWGRSKNLYMVTITVGFIVCATPVISADRGANGLALGIATLMAALWGTAVGWLMGRHSAKPQHPTETWTRTWAYAITLALLTAIAAFVSVTHDFGHAGGWVILTVTLVFQPYLKDAWDRTWQRAVGTVIGVVVAIPIYLAFPWTTALVIIGSGLMIVAMVILMNPKCPYWLYSAVLTPAIVLLVGGASASEATDLARLVATLAGAGLALAAEAFLRPIYRADAKGRGVTHA